MVSKQRPSGGCTNCGGAVRTMKPEGWLCAKCAKDIKLRTCDMCSKVQGTPVAHTLGIDRCQECYALEYQLWSLLAPLGGEKGLTVFYTSANSMRFAIDAISKAKGVEVDTTEKDFDAILRRYATDAEWLQELTFT